MPFTSLILPQKLHFNEYPFQSTESDEPDRPINKAWTRRISIWPDALHEEGGVEDPKAFSPPRCCISGGQHSTILFGPRHSFATDRNYYVCLRGAPSCLRAFQLTRTGVCQKRKRILWLVHPVDYEPQIISNFIKSTRNITRRLWILLQRLEQDIKKFHPVYRT